MSSDRPLQGKITLVTGSSSEIGSDIVRELSAQGAIVIINYPDSSQEASAREVLKMLQGNGKAESIKVHADLATHEGPKQLATAVSATHGRLDILVNNAGCNGTCSLAEATDAEIDRAWDDIVTLNGRGTLLLTRAVLPLLSPTGSRIINIGSSTSRDPDPDMSIYAGSKAMVETFTRCWARDLPRKHGCTVNTVAPGPVATEGLVSAPDSFLDQKVGQGSSAVTFRDAGRSCLGGGSAV